MKKIRNKVFFKKFLAGLIIGLFFLHHPPLLAQSANPALASQYYQEARQSIDQQKWTSAISKLQQAIQHNPDVMEYHSDLAYAYYMNKEFAKALQEYKAASQLLKTRQAELQYNMGIAAFELGNPEEAIQYFEETIRLKPDWADAHHNLGAVFFHQGKYEEALKSYRLAQQHDPLDKSLQQSIQEAEERQKQVALISTPSPSPGLTEEHKTLQPSASPTAMASLSETIPPKLPGEIEFYQRKHVSFFQKQINPLNGIVKGYVQQEMVRFDYHLLSTAFDMDLLPFLKQVKQYQKEHAGEIAAKSETENAKFDDKVVPWSETKLIMNSAYVFAPVWAFSPMKLLLPQKVEDKEKGDYWAVYATSDLKLAMDIYKLASENPEKYATVNKDWPVSKEHVVTGSDFAEAAKTLPEDEKFDTDNPAHLKLLRDLLRFQEIAKKDPYEYLMADAEEQLTSDEMGFRFFTTDIKRLEDFILKGEVQLADMPKDRVDVGFGDKETPKTLGVRLDDGFKILETLTKEGTTQQVEVGFIKVREIRDQNMGTQPIIVGRDFELGDQVKEYPKVGVFNGVRFGTVPVSLGFDDKFKSQASWFTPQAQVEVEYSLARWIPVSELHSIFNFGLGLPITHPDFSSKPVLTLTLEGGFIKRWYWRQLIFSAALKGGALSGSIMNADLPQSFSAPSQSVWMITPTVGVHYQLTPDIIFGLDAGWRFAFNSFDPKERNTWKSENDKSPKETRKLEFPGLGGFGPVLQVFGNYVF